MRRTPPRPDSSEWRLVRMREALALVLAALEGLGPDDCARVIKSAEVLRGEKQQPR